MVSKHAPDTVWTKPSHFLAFGLGSGAIPFAPGTMGTIMAIPFFLLLQQLPLWAYSGIVMLSFLIGCRLCDIAARDTGVHDHSGIVWDEMVGYWITMWGLPKGYWWLLAGFILFRFFDIVKPWPIRAIDRHVKGGFGIMLDDVIAAFFASCILQLTLFLLK